MSPRKFAFFQPDEFARAEKGKRLQRLNRRTNPRRRLVGIVGATVERFDAEIARLRGRQPGRQLGGGRLDRALVGADHGVDVRSLAGGFGFHRSGAALSTPPATHHATEILFRGGQDLTVF